MPLAIIVNIEENGLDTIPAFAVQQILEQLYKRLVDCYPKKRRDYRPSRSSAGRSWELVCGRRRFTYFPGSQVSSPLGMRRQRRDLRIYIGRPIMRMPQVSGSCEHVCASLPGRPSGARIPSVGRGLDGASRRSGRGIGVTDDTGDPTGKPGCARAGTIQRGQ